MPRYIPSIATGILLALFAPNDTAAAEKLNFNPDWRFIKQDVKGAEATDFDDRSWQPVSTPHTYNDTDTFDNFSPLNHMGELDQWGGKTWYRKVFDAPADWHDKTVIVEFEAVRQVADVFINGVKAGHCENGFIPFGADLSAHLKPGQRNVIAVAVDNTFVKDTDGNRNKIWHDYGGGAKFPWNNPHWHPAHGGIYRNVYLHVSDKLHLTQPLFNNMGTVGTYAWAIDPSRERSGIGIEAEVKNDTADVQTFAVRNRLRDSNGNVVMDITSGTTTLKSGDRTKVQNTGALADPQLWEPGYPYLYQLSTEIVRNGQVVDSHEIPFGIRWIKMTTDSGFYINDRHVKLQGWGQKSMDGWPGLGAANPDWMHHETLRLITAAGGNFVRWGHTAGSPAQLRASDELGIVTEQPGVDGEGDTDGHAWDVRLEAWRDTVVYFRNNPSLLIWEGGNQSTTREHAEELKKVVTTWDPHGGRAFGFRRANNTVKPYCDLTISTEGSGYLKDLPTIEGEYDREESPRRVWDRKTPGFENWHASGSYDLTSEDFAINQLFQYEKIAALAHCGGANWIFTDSTSGGRVSTEVTRAGGEVDAMRLPKQAYFVCRVIFTDKPDIHLIGHWNFTKGTVKDIHVAGDCDEVALFLNGREIGRHPADKKVVGGSISGPAATPTADSGAGKARSSDHRRHPMLFTFKDVTFAPGSLTAVGYKDGSEVDRNEIRTAGPATALRLTPMTGPTGLMADGSDAVVFDVEAMDADGNRCPTFGGRVDFQTSGPGVWRGGYNSGKEHSTNHPHLDLEAGINRVIIRSTRTAGPITLAASAQGLASATITVDSRPLEVHHGITAQLPATPQQGVLSPLPLPDNREVLAVKAPGKSAVNESTLLEDVSYSGPSGDARIDPIKQGAPMYTDHSTQKLPTLPEFLRRGEYIRLPNSEWNYSAVDLLQFGVKKDATVYVAHDVRLKKPAWLSEHFTDTGKRLTSGAHNWSLFKKNLKAGESVLLGSNTEDRGDKRWQMVVFVIPSTK